MSWTTSTQVVRCGGCGRWLKPGTPFRHVEINGMKRKLIRCACWGEAPPDLPSNVVQVDFSGKLSAIKKLGADWKEKAAGS